MVLTGLDGSTSQEECDETEETGRIKPSLHSPHGTLLILICKRIHVSSQALSKSKLCSHSLLVKPFNRTPRHLNVPLLPTVQSYYQEQLQQPHYHRRNRLLLLLPRCPGWNLLPLRPACQCSPRDLTCS